MTATQHDLRYTKDNLYIAGEWVSGEGRDRIQIENPATEEIIGSVPEATNQDVDRAVAAAIALHRSGEWRAYSAKERGDVLRAFADGLERRVAELGDLYVTDQGGLSSFAPFIGGQAAAIVKANAKLADEFDFSPEHRTSAGGSVILTRQPVGPVAAIVPWNAPLILAVVKIAPALVAGCPVVVKVSPETPLPSYVMAEIFHEIGVPKGLISFLPGGRDLGKHLVAHPDIAHVSFTGSTSAGQDVMRSSADSLHRLTLELGGKSAAIMLDDAEPSEVIPLMTFGSLAQSGQVCTTHSRLFVPSSRREEWLTALTAAFDSLPVGDPADPGTVIGPLVSSAQRDRVEGYLDVARSEGVEVLAGGGRPQGLEKGYYIQPTLITGLKPTMRIFREEVFGPVVSVDTYDTVDDAVGLANDTEFGLANGIYSRDTDRAIELATRLDSGTVSINNFGACLTEPFGGMKKSGLGREGGIEGIEAMLETKQIQLPAQHH